MILHESQSRQWNIQSPTKVTNDHKKSSCTKWHEVKVKLQSAEGDSNKVKLHSVGVFFIPH